MPFVRFYPSDWLAGTRNLNLEEKGLYMEALNYMWSNGVPLPGNDRLAAKLLLVQPLKYQKVMASLIAQGKMTRGDDVVYNERALRDIDAYQAFQAKQTERAQKGWATKKSIGDQVELYEGIAKVRATVPPTGPPHYTPPVVPPSVPGGYPTPTHPVAAGKVNDCNGDLVGWQSTGNAIPESTTRIHIESPKPPEGASDERVSIVDGRVVLFNGLRQFWVDEWGGDEKGLDLALIEVSGRIQKSGSRPLEAQVSSQLARRVADKRDQDKRYQAAAKANASARSGARADAKRLDQSSPEAQMVAVNIWEGAIRR
jgi:uncharacterized protein YdaU (DUF1376 family)